MSPRQPPEHCRRHDADERSKHDDTQQAKVTVDHCVQPGHRASAELAERQAADDECRWGIAKERSGNEHTSSRKRSALQHPAKTIPTPIAKAIAE
jgi:hypothetical protein